MIRTLSPVGGEAKVTALLVRTFKPRAVWNSEDKKCSPVFSTDKAGIQLDDFFGPARMGNLDIYLRGGVLGTS
jgi:hypothetical protein